LFPDKLKIMKKSSALSIDSYAKVALPHLSSLLESNRAVMEKISARLVSDVAGGKSLLVFGSGHSSIFPMELYHRAGGPSFVLPIVADYLLPTAGPPIVRRLERMPEMALPLLSRAQPVKGEMLWIASQSGINSAGIELALDAKKRGLFTVAFTSRKHSAAVESRHPSKKRLFEVCDETVDLGGAVGDASVELAPGIFAGPLSTLGAVFLAHSILVLATSELESSGHRCVYTSVNTSEGERRNEDLEKVARNRDPLLR
jgi:uncharacterized phosphosugar-binding protein